MAQVAEEIKRGLARERALAARCALPFLVLSGLSVLTSVFDRVLHLHLGLAQLLLGIPATLWCLLSLVVGSSGMLLWSLAAVVGPPTVGQDSRGKRIAARLALAACCAAPAISVRALSWIRAPDHVFLTLYADELLEHVERRAGPDNPFFRESSDEDPITLIGAMNYSISDYYWVIHAPDANGRRLEPGPGGFEYQWARHVRGPWYVLFR